MLLETENKYEEKSKQLLNCQNTIQNLNEIKENYEVILSWDVWINEKKLKEESSRNFHNVEKLEENIVDLEFRLNSVKSWYSFFIIYLNRGK